MPLFNIAILDKKTTTFFEEHTSMFEARDAVVRAALLILLEEQSDESKRIAQCHITSVATLDEVSSNVSLEITDFI